MPGTCTTVRFLPAGGMPKGSPAPCTTSVGTLTASSSGSRLGLAAVPAAAWRLQREREAEHRDGAGRLGGAAGHSRAHGATAGDERQPAQLVRAQVVDHRRPGGVELACRSGSASSRDAVGLLDERDADPLRARYAGHRNQIWRRHSSGGAVTEDERGSWLIGGMQVNVRLTVRGVHFEHRHVCDTGSRRSLKPRKGLCSRGHAATKEGTMRGRLAITTVGCLLATAVAPLGASGTGKPGNSCPPGFNLGSKTADEFLALERTQAAIEAGLATEEQILAAFAAVDRNDNGRVCVQLSNGFEKAPVTAYFYNAVDDNASVG